MTAAGYRLMAPITEGPLVIYWSLNVTRRQTDTRELRHAMHSMTDKIVLPFLSHVYLDAVSAINPPTSLELL